MDDLHSTGYILAHLFSGGAILGSLWGLFPAFAAFVALIFYLIQIWESSTVQHYVRNKRMTWKARKLARLKAKQKVITAKLEAMEVVRAARVEAKELVATAAVEAEKIKVDEETTHQANLPPI